MKRVLTFFLVFSLVAFGMAFAVAEDTDFRYEIQDDGTVMITRYRGEAKDCIIPEEIDGKKVTSISRGAFARLNDLKSVLIPFGVVSIGESAFFECESMTSIS